MAQAPASTDPDGPASGNMASLPRADREGVSPAPGAWEAPGEDALPAGSSAFVYRLWRSEDPAGPFALVADNLTRCWYRDDSVANGRAYVYQVTAISEGEESDPSDPASGSAHAGGNRIVSRFVQGAPTINGRILPSEWSAAAVVDITAPGAPPGTAPVTAYLMNNATHLFVAVREPNIPFPDDFNQIGIYYDQNHDGAWNSPPAQPEGNIWVLYDATWRETTNWFRAIRGEWPNTIGFVQFGDVPTVSQSLGFESGDPEFEVAIDVRQVPLVASPGATIGFGIYSDQTGDAPFTGDWPGGFIASPIYFKAPILYGDLVLAPPPGAPVPERTGQDDGGIAAWPNPARAGAAVRFRAGAAGNSRASAGGAPEFLRIFDLTGRDVARVPWSGGSATWDGKDSRGERLPGGIYFVRLGGVGGPAGRVLLLR